MRRGALRFADAWPIPSGDPIEMTGHAATPIVPYLIVGFDVDDVDPNADQIFADVLGGFPVGRYLPLGVENVHILEVSPSQLILKHNQIADYLRAKEALHGVSLRWFVQSCRQSELST